MGAVNLLDARFDQDSCGVGFVASVDALASHSILAQALTALARLAHRGAIASDGKSSDGVGIMTGIPRNLLLRQTGVELASDRFLAVGVLFLPRGVDGNAASEGAGSASGGSAALAEEVFARCLDSQELELLAWRDVPVRAEVLGEIALGTMPVLRHALVASRRAVERDELERRLYLSRKQFERMVERGEAKGTVCTLSSQVMVYKSMCSGRLLPEFYPDLASEEFATPFAIFHQRYATNTLPTWDRAQPMRMLAHNGEINTVWGNRARMDARDATLPAECKPILSKTGTDSTSLDETVELLRQNGRTLAESVRMLLPPAASARVSPFLKYHMDCAEPWDGPAALAFSDGKIVGAALDRNGLRPCRYAITAGGLVVAGSEAGLVDLDPDEVVHSGRLGPGQMLVVDLAEHKVYEDEELLALFDASATRYAVLYEESPLEPVALGAPTPAAKELLAVQSGFGYSREDVRMVLGPMAADGKDAVWSMGDDTPLAMMAHAPRPVYGYFRQRFAQVTNPAIDPLREACVVSLHTRLGPWPHMLDKNAPLPGLTLASPFLSLGQMEALRQRKHGHAEDLQLAELACVFDPATTLDAALDELSRHAVELVRDGARILLLTDRQASARALPVPMAMATGATHHALVRAGVRTLTGLAVEAGDVRDLHHAAVLIGYGAGIVCPWLALETARSMAPADRNAAPDPDANERRMLKALDLGLAKVMSKMGISVVDSYRGAHLFDILGLRQDVVEKCFFGTPAPLSGIGFAEIESHVRKTWSSAGADASAESAAGAGVADLPDFGWVRFRKDDKAEPHHWQPQTVKALQAVVGTARGVAMPANFEASTAAFNIFSRELAAKPPSVLRDLLEIRPAGPELALGDVEAPRKMVKRFVASAMSLGSLSPEAHQTITIAMNEIGGRSNTGEGGEDPAAYIPESARAAGDRAGGGGLRAQSVAAGGAAAAVAELATAAPAAHTLLNNKIKQVASGRFGVTAEYLSQAEELEIKVAQGAKPGEGGQLPGHKVTELIARLRHAQPGVSLISPPPHHDIYSIEDLAQLIYDLKRINPRAAVGVKLVSGCGVGTVAAGVAKAYADYIVIAGNTGGTGASALSSIKYAGNPWELGLAEAQQVLMQNGLRGRVRLRTDGGLATARDVLIAALLGADEYAFGTAVLVVLGCDMARQCHLNSCPTGIATQRPELRAKFRGKPEHVVRFFEQLSADLQGLLARLGLPSLEAAIGRVDLLEQVRHDGGLDLKPMLARVGDGPSRNMQLRNDRPMTTQPLDEAWVAPAMEAVREGRKYVVESPVANKDRSLGARLAGEIALLRTGQRGAEPEAGWVAPDITLKLAGTAGQSFGAFAVEGMRLVLDGQANDFVGKGLSGGEIVLRAQGRAARDSGQHVILGNVALYGATGGGLYAAGRAGERFAVRNSGATAVVEGVGDHGCEYMTGGVVAVLGRAGLNFAAGMTGGIAYVHDDDGSFFGDGRFHQDFATAEVVGDLAEMEQERLRGLIRAQLEKSDSSLARRMLGDWEATAAKFLRLTPKPQA